jgi:hypothetical protein
MFVLTHSSKGHLKGTKIRRQGTEILFALFRKFLYRVWGMHILFYVFVISLRAFSMIR